jgi:exosome complex exonuclease DIS3/RRP44
MKYFPEYQIDGKEDTYSGILRINKYGNGEVSIDKNIYIIDSFENLNRCFDGDIVKIKLNSDNVNYGITNLIKRAKFVIPGILQIHSKLLYGTNKKNMPIYLFKPTDKKHPNFYVASNIKKKIRNIYVNYYCTIELNKWETDQKYPMGQIITMIGEVGNFENEKEFLLYKYGLYHKNINNKFNLSYHETNIEREDYKNELIFSIDPPGCLDIDDALHVKEFNDKIVIGVHIADVGEYIKPNDNLDLLINKRLTSIYAPHKTLNMLPNKLSNEICSLKPNQLKKAFSLIFTFNKEYEVENVNIKKTVINSKYAFSYCEATEYLKNPEKNEISKSLNILLDISKHLKLSSMEKYEEDKESHFIIETFMILTNSTVAKKLFENDKNLALLRNHYGKSETDYNNIIENEKFLRYLKIIETDSANYELGNKGNELNHYGLQLELYTHFTSPIRRYFDLLVHWKLSLILGYENFVFYDKETLNKKCNDINFINKQSKKMGRDYEKLKLLESINHKVILDGYVFELDENHIRIYIPEYNLSYKLELFSKKLLSHIVFTINENELLIENHQNRLIKIVKYQKIIIEISPLIQEDNLEKKLKMKILNPDLSQLIEI